MPPTSPSPPTRSQHCESRPSTPIRRRSPGTGPSRLHHSAHDRGRRPYDRPHRGSPARRQSSPGPQPLTNVRTTFHERSLSPFTAYDTTPRRALTDPAFYSHLPMLSPPTPATRRYTSHSPYTPSLTYLSRPPSRSSPHPPTRASQTPPMPHPPGQRHYSAPAPAVPPPAQRQYPAPAPALAPPPIWTPNVFYQAGALCWYAGSVWRCESAHTSGALAKEPPESLHLWTPVGSSVVGAPGGYAAPPVYADASPSESVASLPGAATGRSVTAPAGSVVSSEWARAAAQREDSMTARKPASLRDELDGHLTWRVGGIGVFAYAEDLPIERLRKAAWRNWVDTHTERDWLQAARLRTAGYERALEDGVMRPLLRWHLIEGSAPLPPDALPTGQERSGRVLYSARTWLDGSIQVGKCADHLMGRCAFPSAGKERSMPFFEVLCGDGDVVEWISFERGMSANLPGWQPVEGGRDRHSQRAILIARANYGGGIQPGKCFIDDDHACVPFNGQEEWRTPFAVLAYATMSRR